MAPLPKSIPSPAADIRATSPVPNLAKVSLGSHLSLATAAIATRTQAPPELVTHHLLTLAAMAAQRLVSVRLPTGEIRPVSCFFATFVGAGERRGAVEKMTLDAVCQWERAYDGEKRTILEHANLFIEPPRAGMHDRFGRYTRRSGMFARHPHDLIQALYRRREEAASLCALWDGKVFNQVAAPPQHPRLSLHLVATPREGRALLADAALADSGFLGRLLCVQPASRLGARTWAAEDTDAPPPEFTALLEKLTALYAQTPTMDTRMVTFSAEAAAAWLAFAQEVEQAMAPGGVFAAIRPFATHMAEHAARLAVVVALIEDAALAELSLPALENGIALARYYAKECLRLSRVAPPAVTEPEREDLLREWLLRTPAEKIVTLRDVCRSGPPAVRNADIAYKIMRRLERSGLVRPHADTPATAGAPRRIRGSYEWRVVTDEAPVNDMSRDVA